MASTYDKLSAERKRLQVEGEIPLWFNTPAYQSFVKKFQYENQTVKQTYKRIAKCAAAHLMPKHKELMEDRFFDLMWKGILAMSTPVLSNMGTPKGLPVSCSGNYVHDSIEGFYESMKETAILTKHGFGTSGSYPDVRHRGAAISAGGTATGVLHPIEDHIEVARKVTQGNARRGAYAWNLPIDHPDFHEAVKFLETEPDDNNAGWIITQEFMDSLDKGERDAIERMQELMFVRVAKGRGYMIFIDKMNDHLPQKMKDLGLKIKGSNLCTEIALPADEDHTFTCVLSSLNVALYDEWPEHTVETATIFLDCVASEFIMLAKNITGLEKAVRFTEKSRALGLGVLGYHTYIQRKEWAYGSFQARMFNGQLFQRIDKESLETSELMGIMYGCPEWADGTRNTHRLAIAPTTGAALMAGGVSQGVMPVVANLYVQPTPSGDLTRWNPVFLEWCKEAGKTYLDFEDVLLESAGSVQGPEFDWLGEARKLALLTAYEINQYDILDTCAQRQPNICQAQSIDLFFDADEDPAYIMEVHQYAARHPNIHSLYYARTMAGVSASKECIACQ